MAWWAGDSSDISSLLVLLVMERYFEIYKRPLCAAQRGFSYVAGQVMRFALDILAVFGYKVIFCQES